MPLTPANQIRTRARNLTIGDCWITEVWEEMREANILVTRNHKQGGVTFGVYLVDLALFGIKDAFYQFNMSSFEFHDFITRYTEKEPTVKIGYPLAHNIIYGAIGYAEEFGFHPHKDFSVAQYILEEDTDEVPLIELEFGVDGLPTIFKSDEEPRVAEIKQLEHFAGKGNYKVIDLGARPNRDADDMNVQDDFFDEEDDDMDDDEDMEDMEFEDMEEDEDDEDMEFEDMEGDEDDEDMEFEDMEDDEDLNDEPDVDTELVEKYLAGVDWQTIYGQCEQLFALKPWETLFETDIFAIKLPGSGREFFFSVMGSLGEMFAISFYEGERAIYKFFELQDTDLSYHPTTILSIPHFMISWEKRGEMEPNQASILEKLGVQYPGENVWPQINQIKPGYLPGIADLKEFKNIGILLGECLAVLPEVIRDRSILWENLDLQNTVFFRLPKKVHGEWVWHNEFKVPEVDEALDKVRYDHFQLEKYKRLPIKLETLQLDIVLQPFPIREKGGEIRYHFTLIAMDPGTELAIMAQMLKFGKRYETALNSAANLYMEEMINQGGRPGKIEFRNPDLTMVLQLFNDLAGTEIVFNKKLEPLATVIIDLIDQLNKQQSR